MKSFLILAALAIGAAAQFLSINTPVNTNPAGRSPIVQFDGQTGTQVTWRAVNVTENTQLLLSVKDSAGAIATSAPFPVTAGSA
ncbi:hypothetical protein K438DRAFT_1817100 [Mycena galopus ATCC 62051]|nr:hypothetical protein K438DRAFT_1817100 [Mycena galopus ATCC 62051]